MPDEPHAPSIDGHLHVFHRGLVYAENARYRPIYDAPWDQLLKLMNENGIDHAVLVQPSFLGIDNRYLLESLQANPARFRGVVVIDPEIADSELEVLNSRGVVGIRYNMIGHDAATFLSPDRKTLAERVGRLGWHVEVQCRNEDVYLVLALAEQAAFSVVLDHFALPSETRNGFALMLNAPSNVYVKISAPYRSPLHDPLEMTAALVEALGPQRLLWGSDWPFTQHENGRSYTGCVAGYRSYCPEPKVREAIDQTGVRFFAF